MSDVVIAALYHFAPLPDFEAMQAPIRAACAEAGVRGTLLLADEGINGTIAGSAAGIDAVLAYLRSDARLSALDEKRSTAPSNPFPRLRVRLKREIVTMGVPGVDPRKRVGSYVEPEAWNSLLEDPDVLVIDTRNEYEVKLGTFRNARSPGTETFREFPAYVERELKGQEHRPIAMFCTGGIRCEKATAYLLDQGFDNVHHLHGGILKYLETVPEAESLWQGECYVFDERVTVTHALTPGDAVQCEACGEPLSAAEQASPQFEADISCPYCIDELTPERRAALEMRRDQRQRARAANG